MPKRTTGSPPVTSIGSGRAVGGSAASGHVASSALASRTSASRYPGFLKNCMLSSKSSASSEKASPGSRIGNVLSSSKKGSPSKGGADTSPTGSAVPGRPIAARGASDKLPTLSKKPAAPLDDLDPPISNRPSPLLPSQRNAAKKEAVRQPVIMAPDVAAEQEYLEARAEDIRNGYTYLPVDEDYPGCKKIYDEPPIFVIDGFLTPDECDNLIKTAGPLLQRSKTHAAAGSEATKGRTSLTCHLPKKMQPCPIMLQKIQKFTNKPYGHMELPQVARYASSQRYVEHYDGVDPHTDAGRAFCASGGQRVATVLMYLNDVSDGGCTRFKRLNLEVKPKKGSALVFFPGFMNGELDTDVLHAGMPAVDTKWVSQVWIRQSFREDGQPSSPVPLEEQSLVGPLHEGLYKGFSMASKGNPANDLDERIMTFAQAKEHAKTLPGCQGFTYECEARYPEEPVRIWFKAKIDVLFSDDWWTWSTGVGM